MRRIIVLAGVLAALAFAGTASAASARHVDVVRSLTGTHVWTHTATTWTVRNYDVVGRPLSARTGKLVAAGPKYATGQGRVFSPNPVVKLGDESLTDQNDADYLPAEAYSVVPLQHLDGSGFLHGLYADVGGTKSDAFSATNSFLFGRTADEFEQVEAYFSIDLAQSYIQSLGFTNVNNEPQRVKIDQWGIDNSAYWPNYDTIKFGKGGVDDAEDQEVIWHEYGHAIQDAQVKGYGTTLEAGSIGEGFGDYWAYTMSLQVGGGPDPACIADWDSVSYTSTVPHCLRRVDLNLHWPENDGGEVHRNGRIWSRALRDINVALGRTVADRIVLESQFLYTPDESFAAASNAAVQTAQRLYGKKAAQVVHDAFAARGFIQ